MTVGFPPEPVYPLGIDNDYTLFLVFNTAEAQLTRDNPPWAEVVHITPVPANVHDVWASNGFANLNGELFYYDSVHLDSNGKVDELRQCARNLGGTPTALAFVGDWVRGFVVAQHHGQIVDAILRIEHFVGENFSTDTSTLDWRIRHLQALPIIADDYTCPSVDLTFTTLSTDPSVGTVVFFQANITGQYTTFTLDFGDGTSTSNTTGTHTYAPNSNIDPTVQISSANCQVVQTPSIRSLSTSPNLPAAEAPFEIPVPEVPTIPDFVIPNFNTPDFNLPIPPFVFPCISLGTIGFPSSISIGNISIPSFISITPVSLPSFISISPVSLPSVISITPVNIPSIVTITPVNIPSEITITPISLPSNIVITPPNIPKTIPITPPMLPKSIPMVPPTMPKTVPMVPPQLPKSIPMVPPNLPKSIPIIAPKIPKVIAITPGTVKFAPTPTVPVNWGTPPPVTMVCCSFAPLKFGPCPSCVVNFAVPSFIPLKFTGPTPSVNVNWGAVPTVSCVITLKCPSSTPMTPMPMVGDAEDFMNMAMPVEMNTIGIPSEIKILPPPDIMVLHDIPSTIRLESNLPENIRIIGPDRAIPQEIKVVNVDIPDVIELIAPNVPRTITIDAASMPRTIPIEVPANFPSRIIVDGTSIPDTIQVVGIPSSIELIHNLPDAIQLVMPEDPVVRMKADPVEVKIVLDTTALKGDGEGGPCFALIPCKR